ncbi:MAG: phosphoserine phosphatase RsbU/P [Acidobacteriota bacterium]|nr:phosphoserine phosphatase RsbU/P [Acidobacteriota bacterium]
MDPTYSLEDVARSSDDMVVRRRFASRNLVALSIGVTICSCAVLIQLASNRRQRVPFDDVISGANALLIFIVVVALYDSWRAGRGKSSIFFGAGAWLRHYVTATTIGYLALQYALFLTFARHGTDWLGWAITFPFFLLAIRMRPAELVLLHLYLVGAAYMMPILGSAPKRDTVAMYVSIAVMNAVCLGIELFTSRSMRREVTAEWTERREQAREQLRMRDELQYARELQLSMLPERAPRLDWIDLAGTSVPATEVGGDYYDYFVEGNRVAVVCGDVAGHGMASGLVLSALRSGFTLLRDSLVDPAAVLRRLHDLVLETSRRRMLVTVTVVLLEHDHQRATIASAGHPPVIIRRADGSIETVELYAPPLGVRLPVNIPQQTLTIAPGDVFVLHSDGIYECRNEAEDIYGLDRLAEVVRTHPRTATADSLRDAIIGDVDRFRGKAPQADDITVVVAKITA